MKRTLAIETVSKVNKSVLLKGWVNSVRGHGKIVFFDLRDRTGLVQIVAENLKTELKPEYVVEIEGKVVKRSEGYTNPKLPTGTVEIKLGKIKVLAKSKELPLPINTDGYDVNEEVRLKYRYLDLRRPRLQRNIKVRSDYVQACRDYLFKQDFTEIETPILTKSTPEGSRDFVVPSRLKPGKFFALPQSPQQYKQLLMTAGFEKYFQVAKCFRDEDLRADRGFEHTQIDIEISFVNREKVMEAVEAMIIFGLKKIGGKIQQTPFPVITYDQAIKQHGSDKFDLRSKKEKQSGILAFAWVINFPFFEKTEEDGWTFTHNPFSQPMPEHESWILEKKNIDKITTSQYDLVCNGLEVAGGSIRSNRPEVLQKVFEIIGYKPKEIKQKFGHMLEAFEYGTPPHGGCAHGFERMLMAHFNEDYLREVQAFPQTGSGKTSVMDAPSEIEAKQLAELHIKSVGQKLNSQGAKALVMIADKKPVMLVLSAATKVDTKAFKKAFKVKDLRMASEGEVTKLTNLKIGSVPPFGNLFDLPVYLDKKLGENKQIVFNAGLHERSVKMIYRDFVDLVKPTLGEFAS